MKYIKVFLYLDGALTLFVNLIRQREMDEGEEEPVWKRSVTETLRSLGMMLPDTQTDE